MKFIQTVMVWDEGAKGRCNCLTKAPLPIHCSGVESRGTCANTGNKKRQKNKTKKNRRTGDQNTIGRIVTFGTH